EEDEAEEWDDPGREGAVDEVGRDPDDDQGDPGEEPGEHREQASHGATLQPSGRLGAVSGSRPRAAGERSPARHAPASAFPRRANAREACESAAGPTTPGRRSMSRTLRRTLGLF